MNESKLSVTIGTHIGEGQVVWSQQPEGKHLDNSQITIVFPNLLVKEDLLIKVKPP
jgi:hypothetical protein